MTDRQKREQREQIANYLGIEPYELIGENFGKLLSECENCGATVYWGCWTEKDLDEAL